MLSQQLLACCRAQVTLIPDQFLSFFVCSGAEFVMLAGTRQTMSCFRCLAGGSQKTSARCLNSSPSNSCANQSPLPPGQRLSCVLICAVSVALSQCALRSRKRAREAGISDEAMEEARDAGDAAEQKAAFIALLLDA